MEGEDGDSESPRSFSAAAHWKRLVVLAAGSFMNFLAGLLILLVIFSSAAGFSSTEIAGFFEGSTVSEETGLVEGDSLYRIDGKRVYIYSDISMLLSRNSDGTPNLQVKRDGELVDLGDVPLTLREYDLNGERVVKYGLYFAAKENSFVTTLQNSWYTALDFARMVWMSLGDLVTGLVGVEDMSGPVGIVSAIAQTGENSATKADAIMNISYFAAFLAVNLAVMNMLPIPALDGGRVFFLAISWLVEAITKKKLNPKYEGYIHAAGMVLLLGFIAVITLKDIVRLFG